MLNSFVPVLTPRKEISHYHLIYTNDSTLKMLRLLFEFKLATGWQLSRFMLGVDKNSYIYKKLGLMWQTGLLESFKVYTKAGRFGAPLYYMLSKQGLEVLYEHGRRYEWEQIKTYPKPQDLLSSPSFWHEEHIVELASLESQNQSKDLTIDFLGEMSSREQDDRYDSTRNYTIEALTPDYTVIYTKNGKKYPIYTEYERTRKSHKASLKKIDRYHYYFLYPNENKKYLLRIIFETPGMEEAFWLNLVLHQPSFLNMNIITTNIDLLYSHKQFLEPVYANKDTAKLTKESKLEAHVVGRVRLMEF
jgi:hypothetical protein